MEGDSHDAHKSYSIFLNTLKCRIWEFWKKAMCSIVYVFGNNSFNFFLENIATHMFMNQLSLSHEFENYVVPYIHHYVLESEMMFKMISFCSRSDIISLSYDVFLWNIFAEQINSCMRERFVRKYLPLRIVLWNEQQIEMENWSLVIEQRIIDDLIYSSSSSIGSVSRRSKVFTLINEIWDENVFTTRNHIETANEQQRQQQNVHTNIQ